ncbi:hypothetical protein [Sinomonas gamaensis]|jgi:hypothetical protein|uniref:hypothetical protein n=1 Tax=Sinomonas gamaensis TaxID=2565624 RepID=UPI00110932AA|nr:hypothetical protein [Sinomonas gamaensis]
MAISRDGQIKVADGKVFEYNGGRWVGIGQAVWTPSGDFIFIPSDPSLLGGVQPVGDSDRTLADSISMWLVLKGS